MPVACGLDWQGRRQSGGQLKECGASGMSARGSVAESRWALGPVRSLSDAALTAATRRYGLQEASPPAALQLVSGALAA